MVIASVFAVQNNFASAENTTIEQTLISKNITTSEYTNIYGATNTNELSSRFTPFDFEQNKRMTGTAITPTAGDHNSFSCTYNLLSNGGLNYLENNLSFGMWIYFSTTEVNELQIRLIVDDDNYYMVNLSRSELKRVLAKSSTETEPGYAWNYIELPIRDIFFNGQIANNSGELLEFLKIQITYTHTEFDSNVTYSRLKFYGLDIISSDVDEITATDKQNYYIYKFNFWDYVDLNAIVVGDTLTVPAKSVAVSYAWIGETNLLEVAGVSWTVEILSPSRKEQTYHIGSGEKIELTEWGDYVISFRAFKDDDVMTLDLYDSIEIDVKSNNLIYFTFSSYKIKTNENKLLSMQISPIIDTSSIEYVEVIADNELVDVSLDETNHELLVSGKKSGTTNITIKILAKRNTNSSDIKEYTNTIKVKVVNEQTSSNYIFRIILWIVLGIILLVGLIFGVKSVVTARKNDVK